MTTLDTAKQLQARRKRSLYSQENIQVDADTDARLGRGLSFILLRDESLKAGLPGYRPENSEFLAYLGESPGGERIQLSSRGFTAIAPNARFGWDYTSQVWAGNVMINPLVKALPVGYPYSFKLFIPQPPDVLGKLSGLAAILSA